MENIDNNIEYSNLIFISSGNITGIPTEKDLLDPVIVDKLIIEGKIDNYTSEDFEVNEIPVFIPKSINTTNSNKTGIFYINGEFSSEFKTNKTLEFYINFSSGEKALCKLPKVNGTGIIQIECEMQEDFKGIIIIPKISALNVYKEIFRINNIKTDNEITIRNYKEVKAEKLFNICLSFKQVSGFENQNEEIIQNLQE